MKNNYLPHQTLTKEDIERAYHIAATVVAKFGDVYLPIFERLHNELKNYNENSSIKSLALEVASGVNMSGNKK